MAQSKQPHAPTPLTANVQRWRKKLGFFIVWIIWFPLAGLEVFDEYTTQEYKHRICWIVLAGVILTFAVPVVWAWLGKSNLEVALAAAVPYLLVGLAYMHNLDHTRS